MIKLGVRLVIQYGLEMSWNRHAGESRYVGAAGIADRQPSRQVSERRKKQATKLTRYFSAVTSRNADSQHPRMHAPMREKVGLSEYMRVLHQSEGMIQIARSIR